MPTVCRSPTFRPDCAFFLSSFSFSKEKGKHLLVVHLPHCRSLHSRGYPRFFLPGKEFSFLFPFEFYQSGNLLSLFSRCAYVWLVSGRDGKYLVSSPRREIWDSLSLPGSKRGREREKRIRRKTTVRDAVKAGDR